MNLHELVSQLIIDTKGTASGFAWPAVDSSLGVFAPELVLCLLILVLLVLRAFGPQKLDPWSIAFPGALVALWLAAPWHFIGVPGGLSLNADQVTDPSAISRMEIFTGMLVFDPFAVFMRSILIGFSALFLIFTKLSGIPDRDNGADVYALVLGATLGMCLMTSANHLLMVFMAVEMASVPSYVLAGLMKGRRLGSEAALKYAIYGAGAAGVMLYGISLISGLLNTAHLPTLSLQLATRLPSMPTEQLLVFALAGLMIMVGLAFKLSAFPFHFWCPDVFEGATAEVNAFLSVASKAAAIALLVRVAIGFGTLPPEGVQPGQRTLALAATSASEETAVRGANPTSSTVQLASQGNALPTTMSGSSVPRGDSRQRVAQTVFVAVEDNPAAGQTTPTTETAASAGAPTESAASPAAQPANSEPTATDQPAAPAPVDSSSGGENAESAAAEDSDSAAATPVDSSRRAQVVGLAISRDFMAKLIAFFAVITCTFGNLAAYGQQNIKRLLAYSTIAHAGYLMMPVPAMLVMAGINSSAAETAVSAIVIYVSAYVFMNLGAFAIIAFWRNVLRSEEISDYAGLIRRCPITVVCFVLILFALVGLPPLSGFIGKFAVFAALAEGYQVSVAAGQPANFLLVVLVAGGLNTALSLFYYLRVAKVMTIDPEPEDRPPFTFSDVSLQGAYVWLLTLPTALLILNWDGLNRWAQAAAKYLFA